MNNRRKICFYILIGILVVISFAVAFMTLKHGEVAYDIKKEPLTCAGIGAVDVAYGVVCYAAGKLIDKEKKTAKKIFALLGAWNGIGGMLFILISLCFYFIK